MTLKDEIAAIIGEYGVENLSCKSVRVHLETQRGLEAGDLKGEKAEIQRLIDQVISEIDEKEAEEEEEEEEAPPPKKRSKAESSAEPEEKKPKTFTCTTRSGGDAPKAITLPPP